MAMIPISRIIEAFDIWGTTVSHVLWIGLFCMAFLFSWRSEVRRMPAGTVFYRWSRSLAEPGARFALFAALFMLVRWIVQQASHLLPQGLVEIPGGNRGETGAEILVLIAAALFVLKASNLRLYAFFEGIFGFILAANSIGGMKEYAQPTQLLGLISSLYLLVRAIENFDKDFAARHNKVYKTLSQRFDDIWKALRRELESAAPQRISPNKH